MSFAEETLLVAAMNGDHNKVRKLLEGFTPEQRKHLQKGLDMIREQGKGL